PSPRPSPHSRWRAKRAASANTSIWPRRLLVSLRSTQRRGKRGEGAHHRCRNSFNPIESLVARHQRSLTSRAMAANLPAGRNAMQKAIITLAAAAVLTALSNAAEAQGTPHLTYPDRPVTLVVPY